MPPVIKPPKLRPHATIGIVAPASPMNPEKLERGVRYLEKQGYRVEIGESVHEQRGHLAGPDDRRARDLMRMFERPDIDAIFCVRGGYGTPRLLPLLDYDLIRQHPKILVGYSDITALQLAVLKYTGLVTFTGPMVAVELADETFDPRTEERFWRMLSGDPAAAEFLPLQEDGWQASVPQEVTGPLIGGCLSLVAAVLGTPYVPSFEGAILLIEDVGEEPYRIDGNLAHLRNAGILQHIRGAVLGRFEDCSPKPNRPSLSLQQVLEDYFEPLGIPLIYQFDYGHGKIKHTLPIGLPVRMRKDPYRLELAEPAFSDA